LSFVSLELSIVLAVGDQCRIRERLDRLAGDANVQPDEMALLIETCGQFALRDRAVEVVPHVLLARPDHLDRDIGELPGDGHRLPNVILVAARRPKPPPRSCR